MAKILRVDHIGIAVRDINESIARYEKILGAKLLTKAEISMSGSKIVAAYIQLGESIIVLDGVLESESFIAKFIERRGEGVQHIGLEVDNLDEYIQELEEKRIRIVHRESFGNMRREILLSPKDICGVIYQIIEWRGGEDLSLEKRLERIKRFAGEEP
jgi:methylmalonyl-CoA/ethylmalonyl-CoA epimerase